MEWERQIPIEKEQGCKEERTNLLDGEIKQGLPPRAAHTSAER
jgi:hypothetical protein